MKSLLGPLSRLERIPVVDRWAPRQDSVPNAAALEGYLRCQRVAREAAAEVAGHLRAGWTERQAADLLGQSLRDRGVGGFFHHPFCWFGERTRFDGIDSYGAFAPTDRTLKEGEVFILDVAPIVEGFTCDIGYTGSLGKHPEWERARSWLLEIREALPALFESATCGADVWSEVDRRLKSAGWDNIHQKYPFGVLGHRVARVGQGGQALKWWNFGWQSYWALASRGVFGQLLSDFHRGPLLGLWAVEPHIGGVGFGAKFEELLLVTDEGARWLDGPFFG